MKPLHFKIGATALALAAASCSGEIEPGRGVTGGPGAGPGAGPGPFDPGWVDPTRPGLGAQPPIAGAAGSEAIPPSALGGSLNLAGSPEYFRVVGLTKNQWRNSVRDLFGVSALPAAAQAFQEAVSGTTDFTNNELVLDIDSRGWSDYQAAAEELAQQVAGDSALLSKLYPGNDAAGFVTSVGRRIYRRPLTQTEVGRLQMLFDIGAQLSGSQSSFAKGAAVVLEAMLQSPNFLYRTELGPVGAALSGYEVAAKLSLWLRDTTPDVALLDAAERGELDTPEGAAVIAQAMLEEAAAKEVMRQFHGQLLHFNRFSELTKVGVADFDPEIGSELAEASYRFFDKVFAQGLGLDEVFLSTSGFVGPRMAKYYDLGAVAGGLEERDLGSGRLGYFTQVPFLMLYAHNDDPDAIHRGVSMSLDVLCAPLGPPAAVIPPLPMARPGQTNRMRVDEHTSGCGAACHNEMINPLGFAFENFDGMGKYRTAEQNGSETLPIDASGAFTFVDGRKSWQNATELMQVLAANPQAHLCYAKKLASFGLQRDIVAGDTPLLETLAGTSEAGSLKQVVVTLVQTDAFRTRAGGMP